MDDTLLNDPVRPAPTAQRPLLGLTVLAVEDSRYASEALRLLALRSGARIRRADCIASARRHLGTYLADVAIVDLGLPDGSGLDLIGALSVSPHRPGVILATSGIDRAEAEEAALRAGADAFLPKPIDSLAAFQQIILEQLPPERRPKGIRALANDVIRPDRLAMAEDLTYAARLLDDETVDADFVAGFLQGVARTGRDEALMAEARDLRRDAPDTRSRLRQLITDRQEARRIV